MIIIKIEIFKIADEDNIEYTNDPNIKITEKESNLILSDSEDDFHYIKEHIVGLKNLIGMNWINLKMLKILKNIVIKIILEMILH